MVATLLELARSTHEDIERFQQAILEELDYQPKNFKENVLQSNKVKMYLDNISQSVDKLIEIYEDKDGLRKEEINALSGTGPNLYSIFYERLREVKEYHRKFPNLPMEHPDEHIYIDDYTALPPFTGEEGFGKCLDLNYLYEIFINLKMNTSKPQKLESLDYMTYLENYYKFNDENDLKDEEYKNYLKELLNYLEKFLKKSQPLNDWNKIFQDIHNEVLERWNNSSFKCWNQDRVNENNLNEDKKLTENMSHLSTNENGNNKNENTFFCSICNKKFSKDTVFNAHKNSKKHKAVAEKKEKKKNLIKECYLMEMKINEITTKFLQEQIDNSKTNIQKRQARSAKERMTQATDYDEDGNPIVEEEYSEEEEEEEEEEPAIKTTIDNYPIGWDGKPIPYWLYKLHGLGVEYKCEICGNTSYWGRKAYEKHFQEWRHAHGMRCLGIPNSKHFLDITKINDAIALWEKLRADQQKESWKPDVEEEFEDKEGNVFNKKIYEDLKRQGLI
jgi:splicing factor 3A subunit 3